MKQLSEVLKDADLQALVSLGQPHHGQLELTEYIALAKGKIHEASGNSADMFAVLVAAHLQGPVIWVGLDRDVRSLAPTALQNFLDPSRLIMTEALTRAEVLWAAEQAMRSSEVSVVITELSKGPNLRESRRLQIASEQSGCIGIILIGGRAYNSAAETRWQCDACADHENAWIWRLIKNKKGELSAWRVICTGDNNAPGIIHLAATAAT